MTKEIPSLKSLEHFLFEVPLYAPYSLNEEFGHSQLYGWSKQTHEHEIKIDGHCPYCNRQTTFSVSFQQIPLGDARNKIAYRVSNDRMAVLCSRNRFHCIYYFFRIEELVVQKIGQYPSLADIANDEVAIYRKDMERLDAQEFHKAIGLAAHGVGVGSFVYLRRVFERLIERRFEESKDEEGWQDAQFHAARMEDKINLMKEHLPEFLVDNRKIYSILSVGVHALDDKTCLSWFDAMKQSIIIILEDDKKKKDELKRRKIFAGAIANFSPNDAAKS
ncbi:hypothetical protein [Martelella sp. HB161492]|uniref:hypothetical protein n=1 Tax=Martelella sp. HB161492 TaxID=2720726 RepID=UPI00158FFF24|nr:hypothetical protein [Martelella sp. HB161492]